MSSFSVQWLLAGKPTGIQPAKHCLARISHRVTTATAQCGALTGVHSVGRLDVVSTTPARPSVANAGHHTTLSGLATRPCEKSGLASLYMRAKASDVPSQKKEKNTRINSEIKNPSGNHAKYLTPAWAFPAAILRRMFPGFPAIGPTICISVSMTGPQCARTVRGEYGIAPAIEIAGVFEEVSGAHATTGVGDRSGKRVDQPDLRCRGGWRGGRLRLDERWQPFIVIQWLHRRAVVGKSLLVTEPPIGDIDIDR